MENPTLRFRANFTTTTKGIYTPDVTVEISNVSSDANMEEIMNIVSSNLGELHDRVCEVAESRGYVRAVIEQK